MPAIPEFRGRRFLVVEDDYLLATDVASVVERAGGEVVGPFSNARAAKAAIDETDFDCALVDINLGEGPSFEIAELLVERGHRMIFVTGYGALAIPPRFAAAPRIEKPIDVPDLLEAIDRVLHAS